MTGTSFRAKAAPRILKRPPKGRVLVVAPHPDDETMGPGGTLVHHRNQGDPISTVFVCAGLAGDPDGYFRGQDYAEIRAAEARAAAQVLGISSLHFWGYQDNLSDADIHVFEGLPADPDLARRALAMGFAARLAALIAAESPDIVYYPWEGELHGDHFVIGQGVSHLIRSDAALAAKVAFLGYDVWTALAPDLVIDTSDTIEDKVRAVHCYRSQELYLDYVHPMLGLDSYRSLFLERGATYGEAFVGRYHEEPGP